MLKITKNVPIPPRGGAKRQSRFDLAGMATGDVILAPDVNIRSVRAYVSRKGKELGKKFAVRKVWLLNAPRKGWITTAEDVPGAVLGAGIWRVK